VDYNQSMDHESVKDVGWLDRYTCLRAVIASL